MTTQWHPIFAQLLRPLVDAYYDVQTDVPVSDVPRAADLLLLRRTSATVPPFTGLWRWLTPWNVLEFKGPTVSARLADLDALLELGLGIHRCLNEERVRQRLPRVGRGDMSLWYLANHLGQRFLRSAQAFLGPLEALAEGVWRVPQLQRGLVLVSGQAVAVERDSLALHALAVEPPAHKRALAQVLRQNLDLWPSYAAWLAGAYPALAKEIAHMGRSKSKKFVFDFRPFIEEIGWREIIQQTGLKSLVEEVGVKSLVEEVGMDRLWSALTPRQRRELQRRLEETAPSGE